MGKNNYIFVYMDPPKSREERRREKEAARQRKIQKKEEKKRKRRLLTCKEILWLLEHEDDKKASPQQIKFWGSLFISLCAPVLLVVSAEMHINVLMLLSFILLYNAWKTGFSTSYFWVLKDARRIIADSLDQEYLEDYVSKYGKIE